MNEQELKEIEARAEAATPGPWEFDQKNIGYAHHRSHYGLLTNASRDTKDYWLSINVDYGMEHNANFIAHARQDVPALVAEVRRLTNSVEALALVIEDETGMLSDAPLTAEKLEEILHTLKDQRDYAAETAAMHTKEVVRMNGLLDRDLFEVITELEIKVSEYDNEIARLREALYFYSNDSTYSMSIVDKDRGKIARNALNGGAQ